MQSVAQWVRELALVVLAGTLLEMLLPQSYLRRYARVIVGLLVVLAMLTPVVNFLREGLPGVGTAQGWALPVAETERILERGARWRKEREVRALEEYRQRLARRAETVAEGVPGVRGARARVTVSDGTEEEGLGTITRLDLEASLGMVRPVTPVDRERGEGMVANRLPEEGYTKQIAGQLRSLLARYFGLDASQVYVRIVGEVE